VRRFYHADPMAMTLGELLSHLGQIERVDCWERGEPYDDRDTVEKLPAESFAMLVAQGKLDPKALLKARAAKTKGQLTAEGMKLLSALQ
jgi:hypothetical protein